MSISTKTLVPTGTWNVDPSHSSVGFSVKHMGISTVRGVFTEFEGSLEIGEDLGSSRAYGTVKTRSVDTSEPQRDAHLRSADFFDVERYPELRFESSAIEALDDDELRVVGNLTMHGITRRVVLQVGVQGADTDPWGQDRVGLEVSGQLSRGDFNMKFNQLLGSGNVVVGDKVKLSLDISAIKQA